MLAFGDRNGNVFAFDLDKQEYIAFFERIGFADSVRALAFKPDGNILALCGEQNSDQVVMLLDLNKDKCISLFKLCASTSGSKFEYDGAAFSQDGAFLAIGYRIIGRVNERVTIWDVENQTCINEFKYGCQISGITISPYGMRVAVVSGNDGIIKFWTNAVK
jgi:WD40 repeat protein